MYILDLSNVLMYELLYDYIKNKYGNNLRLFSLTLIVWCMKLKPKMLIKIFAFSNY